MTEGSIPVEMRAAGATTGLRTRVGTALTQFAILWAFLAILTGLSIESDAFFTAQNIRNLLNNAAPQLIIGAGGTLVIITGCFDLSAGAVFALSTVVAATLTPDVGAGLALAAGVGVGAAAGMVNGLLVTAARVNSFMATLASSLVLGGVAFVITNGSVVVVESESYARIGTSQLFGTPLAVFIAIGFTLVVGLLLATTVFGRHVYAAGDNAEAASLAGINVGRVVILTFMISGLAAGLAGVIYSSRFQSGQADAGGITLTFAVVAAIVVGGTSIQGGEGAVWRTFVGVLLIAVIGNGFNLLQIDATYQQIVQGLIILGAVALDAWTRLHRH